ncbi:MAG TPA: glycoside hydrolase family 25 protein [Novosphingobium sp.]|nr:glycoside hydrolase family 25 protein [Novosphingobium sp.]
MARSKRMGAAARRRWLAFGGLLAGLGLVAGWWVAGQWMPARERFPVQGVEIAASDGAVNFAALKAARADFAYLRATSGTKRDPAFGEAFAQAREAGLQVGAVHRFDPCADAGAQAGVFVTVVPRDAALLPPAVELELDDVECAAPPAEGAMASELTTFLNQVEAHAGKPAILKLSKPFEKRYHLAAMIDRNLWVTGAYLAPGYPGRPWVMWTANPRLRSPAADARLRWVVVRP